MLGRKTVILNKKLEVWHGYSGDDPATAKVTISSIK